MNVHVICDCKNGGNGRILMLEDADNMAVKVTMVVAVLSKMLEAV